jgi:prepilin-type N-terminal cleavage/methylation domain-containing protein
MPRRSSGAGLSLLELVIVLIILGVLATAAVTRFSGSLAEQRALAAAQRIAADLESLRSVARTNSQQKTITFSTQTHSYSTASLIDPDWPGQTYQVSLIKLFQAKLSSVNFGGDAVLNINGFGMPDSGGSATVSCGSKTHTVIIDTATGKATVQ